jgi:UDP-2-acetamido-3-amino-2,3-dideoxy-glucuronate N-acetyltransferase
MPAGANVRIHPTAEVSEQAFIGEATQIWHQAQVRERARIGRQCMLGKGVYVDFDVTIGDFCKLQNGVYVFHPATLEDGVFLGPGVILTNDKFPRAVTPEMKPKTDADWVAAPVLVKKGAAIGAGATVVSGVTIGAWALVGSGAVVTRSVPDHGLVVGNPARLIGYACACGARMGASRQCGTCNRTLPAGVGG